jgi:hypothetical protein
VEFIEGWTQTFREMTEFENVTKNSIREGIIDIVRLEQERQYSTKGRVNVVKLSGFKTLIKWADKPSLLNKGPYEGKKSIPKSGAIVHKQHKRGRKSIKGRFRPPYIDLSAKPIIRSKGAITLMMVMINNYLHPYQNVSVYLKLSDGIEVASISPFGWSPEEQEIIIGFLPASLDTEPMLTEISIEFAITKRVDSYIVSPIIHFDNTDKGKRETTKCEKREIRIR